MISKTITATFFALLPFFLFAQLPSGAVALYPFNNSANDVSGNGYDGTLTSTISTVNRFATTDATGFTAGASAGTFPAGLVTAMQNDFSIGYWFKTNMTAPSSTQWYGGSALVDAEVCGGTSDWGTALINGGAVAFGIGNPDITIFSPATGYNDGNWHFVTATRAAAAGTINLYIDGAQVATTTGTATTARTAPTIIGLGRNVCVAAGVYTGSLDDVIAYARTLTSTEVSNLYNYYNGIPLPLTWLSFTGQARTSDVLLQWQVGHVSDNDHFQIDHSTDGASFNQIGSLSQGDNSLTQGAQTYRFTDLNPTRGQNFYRIKQVDIDGRNSYSPVVEVNVTSAPATIRLQTNPVHDVVTLSNPGQQIIYRLQILDPSGRIILDQAPNSGSSQITADLHGFQRGYYLLRFSSATTTSTIAFIKL
ncbi:MAG TPA: LamG-like jellyroll fold domain-containing protein [Puia sp.]|nr:LamG-like jellyroll fold domain-containing protein [Puia sp.]